MLGTSFYNFKSVLNFALAVIIILKHATFLCLSDLSPESALTQAEKDYQKMNMKSTIQQFLTPSSQEQSVEKFAQFIMANEIGLFIFSPIQLVSHQVFSAISTIT